MKPDRLVQVARVRVSKPLQEFHCIETEGYQWAQHEQERAWAPNIACSG